MKSLVLIRARISEFMETHDVELEKNIAIGALWCLAALAAACLGWWGMHRFQVNPETIFFAVPIIYGAGIGFGPLIGMTKRSCVIWSFGPGIVVFVVAEHFVRLHSYSGDAGMGTGFLLGFSLLLVPLCLTGCLTSLGIIVFIRRLLLMD